MARNFKRDAKGRFASTRASRKINAREAIASARRDHRARSRGVVS